MALGSIGVTGTSAANVAAAEADLVIGIGTRLQDFTTGSWALFAESLVPSSLRSMSRRMMRISAAHLPSWRMPGWHSMPCREELGDWRIAGPQSSCRRNRGLEPIMGRGHRARE